LAAEVKPIEEEVELPPAERLKIVIVSSEVVFPSLKNSCVGEVQNNREKGNNSASRVIRGSREEECI
jgi:hypothetical protein